jgi:bifunctional non-homologous end joining protein LigD
LKIGLPLPQFTSADLIRRFEPFDHDDYIFELKMDGFRALAYVGADQTRLISRRGNTYKRFTELAAAIHIELDCEVVLDGEIVCIDSEGRPRFYDLLRRRGTPVFYAFDVLWCDGQDLRPWPLLERKRLLWDVVPEQPSVLL